MNYKNLLDSKNCIVSGAGKGFGKEIAKLFNAHNANLALITRTKKDLDSLQDELGSSASKHLFFAGDVSKENDLKDFILAVEKKFGLIDVLINNAGMRYRKKFLDISEKEFNEVYKVNVFSMFRLTQLVIPNMMNNENGGSIVNLSSVAGNLGLKDLSAYITSKAAILGMTKSLAIEYAENNIRINSLSPGFCETSYFDNFKQNKDLFDFTIERTPMKRWGSSEEVAKACLFLSSDLSSYVTGENLNVDGGWSAW
jgi:NAD(P)-dependent dehydrogenase (short-subunit alcohol dehydrogenase family)|tara:strand:- start:63 stop:827 length:765 start_codon:yes stop_codon:yes gene_type:complete